MSTTIKRRRWVSDHIKIATTQGRKTIWDRVLVYRCRGLAYRMTREGYTIVHVHSGLEVLKVGLPVDIAQVAGWLLDEGERRGLKWTWVQKRLWAEGARELIADAAKRWGQ
jgi:hypothetical protein